MKYAYEIAVIIVILAIMISLVFHTRKERENVPTPPESFYTPHNRIMPP